MLKQTFYFLILTLLWFSCSEADQQKNMGDTDNSKLIANVLDFSGTPADPGDRSVYSFCDLGAWHSYSVPDTPTLAGGFIGPFSMARDNGIWIGQKFAHFNLSTSAGKPLNFQFSGQQDQYPGWLEQNLITENQAISVKLRLFYVSDRSIMVTAEVTNHSKEEQIITPGWTGETWLEDAFFEKDEEGDLSLKFSNSNTQHVYRFEEKSATQLPDASTFRANLPAVTLQPSDTYTTALQYSVLFEGDPEEDFLTNRSVSDQFVKTQKRWLGYHEAISYPEGHWLDKESFELLKSKAIQTLIINWKSAAGELDHDGLFPSYAYRGFHGFWAWDSWKHSAALARFEPELAKSQLLAMFDFQNQAGMIADCVFRDTLIENHNWRDTKPPLSVWAVDEIFEQTKDKAFVQEIFPQLMKYHVWWYQERDHNQNGWCEYGSTDGTRVAAAWESGMDNAVRFDRATLIQNGEEAWSLDQESVDLNAYLLYEKLKLSKLAGILGQTTLQDSITQSIEDLKGGLSRFYDDSTQYFFDFHTTEKVLMKIPGPEGWLPLWTGLASEEQAEGVKNIMMSEALFNSKVPLPTLNLAHEEFDPLDGYWRGPVWIDQAYFGIVGLENYGYKEEAAVLKRNLIQNAEGMLTKGFPLHENYHPETGEALNAAQFSWTAAHVLLLLTHE